MKSASGPSFLNGVPELLIMHALREREMYGYELVQAIRASSGDEIAFAEGVIYPVLHLLERDGALTSRRQSVNGRSRVYYALTPAGIDRLAALGAHWHRINAAIRRVLGEAQLA